MIVICEQPVSDFMISRALIIAGCFLRNSNYPLVSSLKSFNNLFIDFIKMFFRFLVVFFLKDLFNV